MGGTIRVLHVDDDGDFVDMTATYLERADDRISVRQATSASEGIDRLAGATFDCVVSDYEMPDTDGIEFLNTVREEYPDLPFILFTGKGSEAVASDAISAGVTDYLQKSGKPEQYDLLANRLVDAVEHRRAETNYREIFGKIPDGIVIHDPADGTVTDMNAQYAAMFGYDREELLGAGLGAILPDESPYTVVDARERIQQAVDRGPQTFEWPGVRKDGERFWAEVHLTPIRLDGSDRILAVVRDISDRKGDEQVLERYRTVVGSVPDMVYVLDADFRFTLVNDAMVDVTGYSREELRGAHASLLFDDDALQEGRWNRERLLAADSEYERLETELETAAGDRIPCEIRGKLLHDASDGEQRDTVGIIRDITDRKAREQELRARSAAMDASIDGMAILDPDETYVFLNQAHADIYGYDDPDAFLGETWRMCYDEDERARFEDEVMPALFDHGHWRGEAVGTREDGSRFPQELSLSLTDDGRAICVVRDITERVERERELERKNDRLTEFASTVSHDLRSPLNVAQGRIELARDDCDSGQLEVAASAIDRSQRLIDDLLTLAREGDRVTDVEPVPLATISSRCWQHVETAEATLGIDTERTIRADRDRLTQLLENLFRNAIEHGGADVTVTVGDLKRGFYVADDGPGIPEDEREQVFEVGYSTAPEGTGFGLSIVADIADAHGWDVGVADAETGGARVEITGVAAVE